MSTCRARPLEFEAGDSFELPAVGGRALPRRVFTEIFYDTAGGRLGLAGFALRRRIENGKGLWRLSVVCDGVPTLDVETPGGPVGPPEKLRELVSAASAGFELAPVLRTRTHATGLRVKAGSRSLAKITVASITLLDGQRTTGSFSEIELEQLAATRKELARLESALRKSGAKRTNGAGPLEQALAREPQPELPLPSTSLEQLRPYLREQYARMLAHDPGVRVGKQPRGPASAARCNAAAALGAEDGRADPRSGLGGRDAERARLARRGAGPGARPRRPDPVPARGGRAPGSGRPQGSGAAVQEAHRFARRRSESVSSRRCGASATSRCWPRSKLPPPGRRRAEPARCGPRSRTSSRGCGRRCDR